MTDECPFCLELDTDSAEESQYFALNGRALPSRLLLERDGLFLFPGIGQIVEGYCLLVPKMHVTCVGLLPSSQLKRLSGVESFCRRLISDTYDNGVITFEHGCNSRGERAGACVDHAHIHVVPIPGDLRIGSQDGIGSHLNWVKLRDLTELKRIADAKRPYLYYSDIVGRRYAAAATAGDVPSQYMRQLVAREVGEPDRWDWRRAPGFDRLGATYRRLSQHLECEATVCL